MIDEYEIRGYVERGLLGWRWTVTGMGVCYLNDFIRSKIPRWTEEAAMQSMQRKASKLKRKQGKWNDRKEVSW